MHPEFWHQRWQANQIGFHQEAPTPLLLEHWPVLGIAPGTGVFVPLAGKTRDMAWLAARGHPVLGIELSHLAVAQFFAEHGLRPETDTTRHGVHHRAGGIELVAGDVFAVDAPLLRDCGAVFDRAALIALPPDMRRRYADEVYAALPVGCSGLLVTLEYPQHERDGPPFAVAEAEVRALFEPQWEVELLERREIAPSHPGFVAGASRLDTVAYALRKR